MRKASVVASLLVLSFASVAEGQHAHPERSSPRAPVTARETEAWPSWLGLIAITVNSLAFDPVIRGSGPAAPSGSDFGRLGYGVANLSGLWPLAVGATVVGTVIDRDASRIALEMAGGVTLAALTTDLLKRATGRARPSQTTSAFQFDPFGASRAFPSGHATAAFALAGAIAAETESPWLRGGAFTLAALVGSARVAARAHWTSDVVAGALVGTLAGYETTRRLRGLRVGRVAPSALSFVPLGDGIGVGARLPFSISSSF
jgi:membrane-associated phospholipid phosphatase